MPQRSRPQWSMFHQDEKSQERERYTKRCIPVGFHGCQQNTHSFQEQSLLAISTSRGLFRYGHTGEKEGLYALSATFLLIRLFLVNVIQFCDISMEWFFLLIIVYVNYIDV